MNNIKNKPVISIIVPVYNAELYVSDCINSLLSQSYQALEIILVDDGSKDSSGLICDKYALVDNRISVFHKENGGVSSARNFGIEHAKGQNLMFVDADDCLINNNYVEELASHLEYDYVVSGFENKRININNQMSISLNPVESCCGANIRQFPASFFVNGLFHSCCGKLYRSSIINESKIRFGPYRVSEDSIFNIQYIENITSWIIVSSIGYCYIHRPKSHATSIAKKEDICSYIALHDLMNKNDIPTKVVMKTMYAQYLSLCLRVERDSLRSKQEKHSVIRCFLHQKRVTLSLVCSIGNLGEWLNGIRIVLKYYL